jgi:choice-of-anchor C domain-containing protein
VYGIKKVQIRELKMKSVLIAATFCFVGAAAQAVTVVNGSFESVVVGGSFDTYLPGNTSLTGWSIDAGSIDHIGNYWQASDGVQSVDLNGLQPSTISQTITGLNTGSRYELSFDMAGNNDGLPVIKSLLASIGSTSGIFTFDTTGTSNTNMGWITYTLGFTASNASMLLSFASAPFGGFDAFGPALDNVSIAAVPLPAGLPLLALGIGGLAAVRRRRKG